MVVLGAISSKIKASVLTLLLHALPVVENVFYHFLNQRNENVDLMDAIHSSHAYEMRTGVTGCVCVEGDTGVVCPCCTMFFH